MKKSWRIFWHVFFWLSMISLFMYLGHDEVKFDYEGILVVFLLYPSINIGLFYLNYLVYIPQFLDKKRYTLYTSIVFITILIVDLGKYGIGLIFKDYVLMQMHGQEVSFWQFFLGTFFTSLTFVFLSTALKFTVYWLMNERIQRDLENQRLTAELAF